MWKYVEYYGDKKPDVIDDYTSQLYVYIRINFVIAPTLDSDGKVIGTHWFYQEYTILKEEWELCKTLLRAEMKSLLPFSKEESNKEGSDQIDGQLSLDDLGETVTNITREGTSIAYLEGLKTYDKNRS